MTSIRRNNSVVDAGMRLRAGLFPCAPHTDELSPGSMQDGEQDEGGRVSVSGNART